MSIPVIRVEFRLTEVGQIGILMRPAVLLTRGWAGRGRTTGSHAGGHQQPGRIIDDDASVVVTPIELRESGSGVALLLFRFVQPEDRSVSDVPV